MAGIDAQKEKAREDNLMKERELALKEREDLANRMIEWAKIKLDEADKEATHNENILDLNLRKEEIKNPTQGQSNAST